MGGKLACVRAEAAGSDGECIPVIGCIFFISNFVVFPLQLKIHIIFLNRFVCSVIYATICNIVCIKLQPSTYFSCVMVCASSGGSTLDFSFLLEAWVET
jgi:hypothetical protein